MQVCQCVINESQGMMIRHLRVVILNLACVLIVTQLTRERQRGSGGPCPHPPELRSPHYPMSRAGTGGNSWGWPDMDQCMNHTAETLGRDISHILVTRLIQNSDGM